MHIASLVVGKRILLKPVHNLIVRDNHIITALRLHHKLQDVEKLTRIATAETEHGVSLTKLYMALLEFDVRRHSTMEQFLKVFLLKRLEHIHLTP